MSTNEKLTRRGWLGGAAALFGTAFLGRGRVGAQGVSPTLAEPPGAVDQPAPVGKADATYRTRPVWMRPAAEPGLPGTHYRPVLTPNGATLPFNIVDGVKVMHLTCEEVDHEFIPASDDNDAVRGLCWGYNGRVHGPTIEAVEGDRLRIYVTNRLPAGTTIHWHGIIDPSGMDGVGGLSQKAIGPGETFKYEFTLWQHGTFMYHSHHDEMTQMGLGMTGMFVLHPREPEEKPPDRDYAIMLHEWRLDVGTRRPNPNEMTEFNLLTMNAKAYPGTAPLLAQLGDAVRVRFGNLGATDHHPIHLHGHHWVTVGTDGGPVPNTARMPETSVLVPVGTTRTLELIANNPGDWAIHCHMTHHTMNQMGHGLPNMIGVRPGNLDRRVKNFLTGYMTMGHNGMGEMGDMGMKVPKNSAPMVGAPGPRDYITMGGMYTNLKVREHLPADGSDPGWYQNPAGTEAMLASAEDLQRDLGVVPGAATGPRGG